MQGQGPDSYDDGDLLPEGLPQVSLLDKLPSYGLLEESTTDGRLQKTAASNSNVSLPRSDGSRYSGRAKADEKVQSGAEAAKQMLNLTSKIQTATNSLYAKGGQADHTDDYDRSRGLLGSKPAASSDSESDSSESSMKSWGRPKRTQPTKADDDSDMEDYDIEGAEERLYYMLGSLKNEKRTEIMTSLNHFYSNRSATVQQELEELDKFEGEHIAREEETADSLAVMQKTFERKNIREVKVLMQASRTLAAGSRGELPKRQRFSKAGRASQGNAEESAAEVPQAALDPSKDIADQPPWDVDHARFVWNRMNDKALKIAGGRANASEVLEAMSVVQDGNLELQSRASLAKAAVETLQLAVEHLSKPHQGNQKEEFEEGADLPSEAVQACIDHLRQRVLATADLEGVVEPPDVDELEEEVQELEKLVAEQEKLMDTYRRTRERNTKIQQALENTKVDEAVEEEADAAKNQGSANGGKSTLMDSRLDARLRTPKAPSALSKMRTVARNAATLADLSGRTRGKKTGEPEKEFTDDGKFEQDPKVSLLREHIKTKDEEIQKAHALLTRMRREKRLLKYCSQKARAGFDSLVTDFNPPKPDEPLNSDDSDEPEESQSAENAAGGSGNEKVSSPRGATKDSGLEQPPSAGKAESEEEPSPQTSTDVQELEGAEKAAERKRPSAKKKTTVGATKKHISSSGSFTPKPPSLVQKIREAEAANGEQADNMESELQERLEELSVQLSKDAAGLKEEKAKSKVLRKEIKDLRKEFALMTSHDRSAPQNLEALNERIEAETETENRIRAQIATLERELHEQAQQLEEAKVEQAKQVEEAKVEQESARKNIVLGTPAEASKQLPQPPANATISPEQRQDGVREQRPEPVQQQMQDESKEQRPASPQKQPQQDVPAAAAVETSEDQGGLAKTMLSMRRARALEAEKQAAALAVQQGNDETAKENLHSGGVQRSVQMSEGEVVAPEVKKPRRGVGFAAAEEVEPQSQETKAKHGVGFAAPEEPPGIQENTKHGVGFAATTAIETPVAAPPTPGVKPMLQDSSKSSRPDTLKSANGVSDGGTNDTLVELVKVQSKTEELRNEITDIDQKMKKLKQAMKNKGGPPMVQVVKEIMGVTQGVAKVQPPAEYFALKKDLKAQQEKIRNIRKKWWLDRRDFETLAEKVRNQVGSGTGNFAGVYQTSSTDDNRSQPPSFAKLLGRGSESAGVGTEQHLHRALSKSGSARQANAAGGQMNATMMPTQFSGIGSGMPRGSALQANAAGGQMNAALMPTQVSGLGSGAPGGSVRQSKAAGGPMNAAMQPMLPMQFSGQTAASFPTQFPSAPAHDHQPTEAPPRRMPGVLSALSRSPAARGGPRQRFEQIKKNAALSSASSSTAAQAAAAISSGAAMF